jgi:DNA-3-methyladenine glycosylase I
MADAGIVRNRRKVEAAITNARATVGLRADGGLEQLVLGFAPERPPDPAATTSPESVALSKTLKKHGFAFVGPTTMFALMQALGIFDPHVAGCHRSGR